MATPKNQSVLKAFRLLNSFHHPDEWLTSCELSRRAHLPEASGYRLIQTLEEIGAVIRGPRGRYRPGMLLRSLSSNVAIDELLRESSQDIIRALCHRLDVTVHLGLLEGGMVTYIAKASTPTCIVSHTKPGSQLEAYCSGLGKVLLAALPPDNLDNFILEGELVPLTPHTITNRAVLRAQLKEVRHAGYAMDDRECRSDMRCIAVPVHNVEGHVIAAMSATGAMKPVTLDTCANATTRVLSVMTEAAAATS